HDLNEEIHKKLETINQAAFQKRPGSREIVFNEEEKFHLHPLRSTRFKLSEWQIATVQPNYHIQIDRMYYSVPYEYIQSEIDVHLSNDLIEEYFIDIRTASHKRLNRAIGQYPTLSEHMPDNHQLFPEHTPENILEWAGEIGSNGKKMLSFFL